MAKPACSNVNPDGTFIDVRLGDNEMAQAAVLEELDQLEEATSPRRGWLWHEEAIPGASGP